MYTYSYTYNADGIRTSKTVNGQKHTYTLNGSQIVSEEWTSGSTTHTLVYLYDESGSPIGLQYRPSSMVKEIFYTYFFEKNMQGDITAIFKENGVKIGYYSYDAWGNVKTTVSSGITALEKNIVQSYNPFRYRGYYYDTESGLYYLQSRYYNPQWGRFLNADGYTSTGTGLLGYNMYAYCNNNPVMGYDPTGEWNWGGVIAGLGIIAATVITVATCGVGSPVGALIATAAIATGATMTYAAATDSAMVIDVSVSCQVDSDTYVKGGVSLIVDFSEDGGIYGYGHGGGGIGYSSGVTYSVGMVGNFNKPEDYSKHFVDANIGSTLGIDHCFDPTKEYSNATNATSISFGKGYNFGVGYDYYSSPIIFDRWG